jgi:biotin carboxylase
MRDIVLFIDVPNAGSRALYYEAARSLGLRPILIARSVSGGKSKTVSDHLLVSRMDIDAILSAIDRFGRERIAGVFSSGSLHAELAARLAAALGRPHADPDAISLCNDKRRLRDFLASKGLNTVDYRHVTTVAEARAAAEELGGAVVVKPVSSTGSDGVRICRTADEAVSQAKRLLKRKPDGALIEKYIDAPQYAVEFFDGQFIFAKNDYFVEGPFPIIVGVDAPARLDLEAVSEIKNYASSILNVIGLLSGPAFIELRYFKNDKYVIEVNPRPSTDSVFQGMTVSGVNLAELCIKFCCGIEYGDSLLVDDARHRYFAGRYLIRSRSSVKTIEGVEDARKTPHVVMVEVNDTHFYRRGIATSALDRIASLRAEAESMDLATISANKALERLTVVYDKFPLDIVKSYVRKIDRIFARFSKGGAV